MSCCWSELHHPPGALIWAAGRWPLPGAGLRLCLPMVSLVVAQPRQATVLSIGDGNTPRVRQNGRAITVRLACIDAPDMTQSPPVSGRGCTCGCAFRWARR